MSRHTCRLKYAGFFGGSCSVSGILHVPYLLGILDDTEDTDT
jgi:hypothetical protein